MPSLRIECLRCGETRLLQRDSSQRLDGGECAALLLRRLGAVEGAQRELAWPSPRAPVGASPAPPRLSTLGPVATEAKTELWGAETRKAVDELPGLRRADPGPGRALARPDQGRGGARERRARAARRRQGRADRRGRRPHRGRRARRPVPDRRLPDRLGHVLEHERERGDRRRSPARTCTRTTTSTWASPRTTSSRPPSTSRRSASSTNDLLPALDRLAASLEAKAEEFDDVVKSGRTHLDGRGAGHARPGVRRLRGPGARGHRARARRRSPRLGKIPLGGTAVGTGPEHAPGVRRARARAARTRRPGSTISPPADPFEAQAARDGLVEASGALKTVAVSLTKIANDIRLMGSGPRAGLAEIALPELQKGSSIMPGKVNPVIPEVVTQVAAQVIGNDHGDHGRRPAGPLRAERLRPADRAQPARLDPAARERVAAVRREVRRRHRGQPREVRALRRADALGGDRAQPVHRLRQGGRDRQGGGRLGPLAARGRPRGGSRRRRRSTRRSTTARWPSRTAPSRAAARL